MASNLVSEQKKRAPLKMCLENQAEVVEINPDIPDRYITELKVYILPTENGSPRKISSYIYHEHLLPKLRKEGVEDLLYDEDRGSLAIYALDKTQFSALEAVIASPSFYMEEPLETLRFAVCFDPAAIVVEATIFAAWRGFECFQERNEWNQNDTKLLSVEQEEFELEIGSGILEPVTTFTFALRLIPALKLFQRGRLDDIHEDELPLVVDIKHDESNEPRAQSIEYTMAIRV